MVVISVALLMLLVQDALSGRNYLFRGHANENSEGTINGAEIEYTDLAVRVNNEVEKYLKRTTNATADDQMQEA